MPLVLRSGPSCAWETGSVKTIGTTGLVSPSLARMMREAPGRRAGARGGGVTTRVEDKRRRSRLSVRVRADDPSPAGAGPPPRRFTHRPGLGRQQFLELGSGA